MAKPIRVGLLWHSANSGNLGVGALTVANLALARQAAADVGLEPTFVVIGMRDDAPSYLRDDEADVFDIDVRALLSPGGYWTLMANQDCVLDIGGGDSFADIYGMRRFLFVWLTKMIAIARSTPLMLSPQTIGPFTRSPYKQLAKMALDRSTAVLARDPASLDALRGLAPDATGVLSVDVAFALPFEDQGARRGGERLRVGVNVSGLMFNEAESGSNRFGLEPRYDVLMRRFIGDLVARPGVEVHLVSHCTASRPWDDDGRIADRLAAEFPSAIRTPNFNGPSDAKSYISGLDFLVAGRMHACIGALSAGTPVVPIAYSRKFSGLFGMLDYGWIIPMTGLDTDQALARLNDWLERRDELARDAAVSMSKVERLLDVYRSELRKLFTAAARSS